MLRGTVFKIQKFCTDDGPGIRTTVFLKGCPLNCVWCHNPEGINPHKSISINYINCTLCGACSSICDCHKIEGNKHIYNSLACTACMKCVEICPNMALEPCGTTMHCDEVIHEAMADKMFYVSSGGGLTISGGEPLIQSDFVYNLLKKAKENNLHCCLETSMAVSFDKILKVLPLVDIFLCDIKLTDDEKHKEYVGISNQLILENIKKLDKHGGKFILRCPIIPTVNNNMEHITKLGELYKTYKNIISLELLPYHNLGTGKSERFGLEKQHEFPAIDKNEMTSFREYLKSIII